MNDSKPLQPPPNTKIVVVPLKELAGYLAKKRLEPAGRYQFYNHPVWDFALPVKREDHDEKK